MISASLQKQLALGSALCETVAQSKIPASLQEMLDMLNGSDTPDLESSASDRHSDASELPCADSQPAPQQAPHPLGNGYAAAAAASGSACPPSGPSRTASMRSSAASTEDVFSPRTGQGPHPPAGLCAQQQQRGQQQPRRGRLWAGAQAAARHPPSCSG